MEETRQPPVDHSDGRTPEVPVVVSLDVPEKANVEAPSDDVTPGTDAKPPIVPSTNSNKKADGESPVAPNIDIPKKAESEPTSNPSTKVHKKKSTRAPPIPTKVEPKKLETGSAVATTETEVVKKSDNEATVVDKAADDPDAEPPVAPPRKSPARRKRLLGKRVRKKTGGETGDGIKRLDPTTSEEEVDNERTAERPEERWKREDKEKEEKERERQRRDEKDAEQWTKLFKQVGVGKSEKSEPKVKLEDTQVGQTVSEEKKPEVEAKEPRRQVPWWKFWKRNVAEKHEETGGEQTAPGTEDEANRLSEKDMELEAEKQKIKESVRKRKAKNKQIVPVVQDETDNKLVPKRNFALRLFSKESRIAYAHFKRSNRHEWDAIVRLGNKCLGEMFLVIMLCGAGAFIFKFTEGAFENFYKCGVKRVKRDFVEELWKGSTYLREDEWKSKARRKLMDLEQQLGAAYEASVTSYSGHRSWSFINALVYSLTVITTIGYGHIAPATTTGKALTIVYAIIGIPMFLILLADFGKLFTRAIKWVWAFVRRLYYTGSCKNVRKTAPVQEVMKGVQLVYDMAAFRRPSASPQPGEEATNNPPPETVPSTPAPSAFVIDEEFNLPITLAIFILVVYILCGATVFWIWEDWSFFDAFYFVFISMSTIGFGDLVPKNKMYMMASIVYLAFGLALTSMCINVVQEKLSDTFRQASAKIGATIGLKVKGASGEEVDLSPGSLPGQPVELAMVHKATTPTAPTSV